MSFAGALSTREPASAPVRAACGCSTRAMRAGNQTSPETSMRRHIFDIPKGSARNATWLLGAALTLLSLRAALAQDFPTRPLRMVVPYAAGGPTDVRARLLAQKMGELLGQQVLVENRPGANTFIGTRAVAEAPADGYTLLVHSSSLTLGPLTFKNPGYRVEDFVAVA